MPQNVATGDFISVLWEDDGCWYDGEVVSYDRNTGICDVLYTDGERQKVNLKKATYKPKERLRCTSIHKLLMDIEDRLPFKIVLTLDGDWWSGWRAQVAKATKLAKLQSLALDLIGQINPQFMTQWWKQEAFDWKTRVIESKSDDILETCLKDFVGNAIDWTHIRELWPDEETASPDSPKQRDRGQGRPRTRDPTKNPVSSAEFTSNSPKMPGGPKRRGRPRKSNTTTKKPSESTTKDATTKQDDALQSPPSSGKRRDRPRKVKRQDEAKFSHTVEPSKRVTTPPMKRRCPGKFTNSKSLVEDVDVSDVFPSDEDDEWMPSDGGTKGNQSPEAFPYAQPEFITEAIKGDENFKSGSRSQSRGRTNQPRFTGLPRLRESTGQPRSQRSAASKLFIPNQEQEAISWISSRFREGNSGVLVYDGGLGEPPTGVFAFVSVKGGRSDKPFLIITSVDVIWEKHLFDWEPKLKILKHNMHSNPERLNDAFDMVITSRSYVIRDNKYFAKIDWAAIIVEESFQEKQWEKVLASLSKKKADFRLLLVGNRVPNENLLPVLRFLEPTQFFSRDPKTARTSLESRMFSLTSPEDESQSSLADEHS